MFVHVWQAGTQLFPKYLQLQILTKQKSFSAAEEHGAFPPREHQPGKTGCSQVDSPAAPCEAAAAWAVLGKGPGEGKGRERFPFLSPERWEQAEPRSSLQVTSPSSRAFPASLQSPSVLEDTPG